MKKRIILATSALALTAGSIFALTNQSGGKTVAKATTEQCPPECCNGNGGDCNPGLCEKGETE